MWCKMKNKNRRRFTRIGAQWEVRLDFSSTEFRCNINNISLSGFYVNGTLKRSVGELCLVELKESTAYDNLVIIGVGSVSRVRPTGAPCPSHSQLTTSVSWLWLWPSSGSFGGEGRAAGSGPPSRSSSCSLVSGSSSPSSMDLCTT